MKAGKLVKRLLLIVGILIVLLLATAIIIPVFFKDKILVIVKKEMNDQLNATTDFKDVDLSVFHSFPNLTVSITGLSIVGKESFKNDTLIAAKSIEVTVDLVKAINGTYDILKIGLVDPRIHAIVHSDGKANWDITKPSPPSAPSQPKPFSMKLRKYSVDNGYIEYDDQQGKMHTIIENLNHSGSGDFSSDNFTLSTSTKIDALTFINGNIAYLRKVKTTIDLDLQVDNKAGKYTFNTDKIQLNGLRLSTKGYVQMPDTINTIMDVEFSTPSNDFKDILSLVPGIYQENFKDIKTTGKLSLSGFVKGRHNKTQIPSYKLDLGIQDGSFQYPDLPEKVSNIQVKLDVSNPDGVTDHTIVDLEKCHLELGAQPFDFHMLLKNPVTDQWIDAGAKGQIDLGQMQKFAKLEAGTKMAGIVNADVNVKGSMAAAQKKQFDQLDARGTISLTDFTYASKDYPDGVVIYNIVMTFNPKNVTVSGLRGQYLKTIFSGDGSIDNFLGYYLHNEALTGSFNFVADKIDCAKWMGTSTTTTTATPAATQAYQVPNNLDVTLHASVGTVLYDNITLTDVKGGMSIRNETVGLENLTCKALGGTIKMNGSYSTKKDKKNPDILFDYAIENVDAKQTYSSFVTAQKMMPAGKYLASGRITTNLTMSGKLQPDMSPVMNSLAGKGDLMLMGCTLSNFPVTDKIFEISKLSQFRPPLKVQDTKLFFTFENGRVIVQPYKMKIGDLEAEIAGSHGFDETIQYGVNVAVPRSTMGAEANGVVNNLLGQAASKGVPIKLGDKVNLAMTITGTVKNPKVETNLKNVVGDAVSSVKEEIKKEVTKKVDSVKTVVKDTVKAITTQVKQQAKEQAKQEVKQILTGQDQGKKPADAAKDAADKAKEGLKGLFKKK